MGSKSVQNTRFILTYTAEKTDETWNTSDIHSLDSQYVSSSSAASCSNEARFEEL